MTYDDGNIFAKILTGDIPAVKLREDARTLAFMDVMPQAPGHALIIPKEAAATILDLSPDMASDLMRATQIVARAVKEAMQSPGIMITQLNGAEAGQTVFHVHMHVIPRRDGLDLKLHARDMADPEELETHAKKIRAALPKE